MSFRPILRIGLLVGLVAITFVVTQLVQPRRVAFSCRSISECYMLGRGHQYQHWLPNEVNSSITERDLADGTRKFERLLAGAVPNLLFLVLTRNENSWSRDFNAGHRSSYDFLDVLVQTNLNLTDATVGVLTSSEIEYENLKESTASLPFGRTIILYQQDSGPDVPYNHRHDADVQFKRRSYIAKVRNYLMLRALEDEQHIVWVDADVAEFSPGIVQAMLHHSNTNASAGIITARCQQNHLTNYDKNAWYIDRDVETVMGPIDMEHQSETAQKLVDTRKYVPTMIEGTTNEEIRPLDSVGGTILYIRANLIRQGANFPSLSIVGTTWANQGWVGVETEGLCYSASFLDGGQCWTLGGTHHVRHSDVG